MLSDNQQASARIGDPNFPLLQMFQLVFLLAGSSISPAPHLVDHWKAPVAASHVNSISRYEKVMGGNGADGVRFMKPERGHEDGCVDGVCSERASGLGDDGVLHKPVHTLYSHRALAKA